jgi:large subunit ribosomal protein L25
MELQELKVSNRAGKGTGPSRRVRVQGNVPGVVYGGEQGPIHIQLNARAFQKLIHAAAGEHAIVQLRFEDTPDLDSPAILKELQHHPVRNEVVHADFMRIRLDQKITTSIAIKLVGTPVGIVNGGVLDVQLRELEIECLALEVPESVEVDITVREGIDIITESDRTIAAVHAPRVVKEETAETVEAGAVPEVGKEAAKDED